MMKSHFRNWKSSIPSSHFRADCSEVLGALSKMTGGRFFTFGLETDAFCSFEHVQNEPWVRKGCVFEHVQKGPWVRKACVFEHVQKGPWLRKDNIRKSVMWFFGIGKVQFRIHIFGNATNNFRMQIFGSVKSELHNPMFGIEKQKNWINPYIVLQF